jgi:hypothetical protein
MELGRHAAAEECEKLQNRKVQIQEFYTKSADALKREATIYLKICILLGIAVVVLLL